MDIKPNLVDMRKPPSKGGDLMPEAMNGETSDYPYGLCIHLEEEQINSLGISEMPEPGESYKVLAAAVVVKSSMMPGGKDPEIGLQITALQLIPEQEEPAEPIEPGEKPSGAKTVLGNAYRNYD